MTTPLYPATVRGRTIFYIDGFNLYYGLVSQTPYRWLDLQRLCELLRPMENIQRVVYFTARIFGSARAKQDAYLLALLTRPLIRIVEGNFKRKTIECLHEDCPSYQRRFFKSREEKRTDVNIAIAMLDDAYRNECDRLILISGDSDLVPAIEMIGKRFPALKINVYIPVSGSRTQGKRTRCTKRSCAPSQLLSPNFPPNCSLSHNFLTL
jgi:uncharacterized LabA/DUF88 family protein